MALSPGSSPNRRKQNWKKIKKIKEVTSKTLVDFKIPEELLKDQKHKKKKKKKQKHSNENNISEVKEKEIKEEKN